MSGQTKWWTLWSHFLYFGNMRRAFSLFSDFFCFCFVFLQAGNGTDCRLYSVTHTHTHTDYYNYWAPCLSYHGVLQNCSVLSGTKGALPEDLTGKKFIHKTYTHSHWETSPLFSNWNQKKTVKIRQKLPRQKTKRQCKICIDRERKPRVNSWQNKGIKSERRCAISLSQDEPNKYTSHAPQSIN